MPDQDPRAAAAARVVSSRTFANAPILRRFLAHVVDLSVQGRTDELKEYALGVEVFARGAGFDPRVDTIVRVQARRLRAKLDDFYEREGRGEPVRILLPKGGYVAEFRAGAAVAGSSLSPATPHRPQERYEGSLPAPRTAIVGRKEELAAVKALLQGGMARLVTLTGPGGSGKTRLAVEAAATLADRFPGGICFVPLAHVFSAPDVIAAIAQRLGLRHTGGRAIADALCGYLARAIRARTLLLLDNFEHVLAAAPLLGALLEAAAPLQILVTSRAVLHVSGEHEYPVPPLPVPRAVDLFVQRATATRPQFSLTAGNADAMAAVCRRLDGLPLAIELAAARVKVFTLEAVRARIDEGLDFLSQGPCDAPARQQTLRKTIDWSHDLLDPAEQTLLRRLSVFRGGCTLEAVEAVCNTRRDLGVPVVDGMASLLDKSLVQGAVESGETRFSMLETLREYAQERLEGSGEAEATRRAHAAYCLVLAEEGNRQLTDVEREQWLANCDADHDNIRAALEWLTRHGDAEWALRLVLALYAFWERREYLAEGRHWTEAVLSLQGAAAPTWPRAKALSYAGAFATAQGDFERVRPLNHQAMAIFDALGDRRGVMSLLNSLAVVERLEGNWPAARCWLEQSLAASREIGDRAASAAVLSNLADVVSAQGDAALARRLLEEALATFRDLGDWRGVGWSLNHLGDTARERGDFAAAREMYAHAVETFRRQKDGWGTARSLADLGDLSCEQGDPAAARAFFDEALTGFLDVGHRRGVAKVLEGIACLAAKRGEPERALRLAGAAAALRDETGAPARPLEKDRLDAAIDPAWKALPSEVARNAWTSGARMSLAEALDFARQPTGAQPQA